MDGPWLDAAAQLRRREGFPAWCRGLRRVSGPSGDVLVGGRFHSLQLKVLSRRWLSHGGVWVSADIGGVVVVGQVILQPGPAACHDEADPVEVWVHVEGPAGRRGRRLLRQLRRITRRSLRRWGNERTRQSPSDHWVPWFTRRPGTR